LLVHQRPLFALNPKRSRQPTANDKDDKQVKAAQVTKASSVFLSLSKIPSTYAPVIKKQSAKPSKNAQTGQHVVFTQ